MLSKLLLGALVAALLASAAPVTAASAPYSVLAPMCGRCADSVQQASEGTVHLVGTQAGFAAALWDFGQGIAGTFASEAQETVDRAEALTGSLGQAVAHLRQVASVASPGNLAHEAGGAAAHASDLARTCFAGPGGVTAAFASDQSGQDLATPWAGAQDTCAALVP